MPGAARFTQHDVGVVHIAHLADGGLGVHGDPAHFAAGETDLGVLAFLGHELGSVAGGPDQLRALAGLELDAVDHGAHGDVLDLEGVAHLDVRAFAGEEAVAYLQAQGAMM